MENEMLYHSYFYAMLLSTMRYYSYFNPWCKGAWSYCPWDQVLLDYNNLSSVIGDQIAIFVK